jgi:hypothetical protein
MRFIAAYLASGWPVVVVLDMGLATPKQPGLAPAGELLSFAGPNESNQSKGPFARVDGVTRGAATRMRSPLR